MASTATEHTATCLVCYETRPLKIVGNCKHSFSTECLSSVFESLDSGSEVFACPTCKVDCPRPWDGVKGLVDFTGESASAGSMFQEAVIEEQSSPERRKEGSTEHANCRMCQYRKKEVRAVSLCVKCGNFYYCQDCTNTHARNKATMNHLVSSLQPDKTKALCKEHDTELKSYCLTCGKSVCSACVMLDHGDHSIADLDDVIVSKVGQMKETLQQQQKITKELKSLKSELSVLQGEAPFLDKQDLLIKDIEDHAEKCIDQVVKWKEDLKAQVKADFKIIRDVPVCLEKVSELVQKLDEAVATATKLVAETESHPEYLEKLTTLHQEFVEMSSLGDTIEGRYFQQKLHNLQRTKHSFRPDAMPVKFGMIDKSPKAKTPFTNTWSDPKEIFKQTMQVNLNDMFIPCVANLGKKFAVAHPTKKGEYSNAIDIYEFPGTLINTLRDHVPPIYDMSSTPDGKLAVLSNGTVDSSCSVQLFDPETGYIRSTCDITDVTKPLSLGVTLQNQYVILGDNEGQKEITVVDKDGLVEHKHLIKTDKVMNPNRITCGGRFIFLKGDRAFAVYEISNKGLQTIKYKTQVTSGYLTDITATVWDEIILARNYSGDFDLLRFQDNEHKQKWPFTGRLEILKAVTGADRDVRVSTRDGHIVMSHGQTIRVYKL